MSTIEGVVSTDAVAANPQTSSAKYIMFSTYAGSTLDVEVPVETSSNILQDTFDAAEEALSSIAMPVEMPPKAEKLDIGIVAGKFIDKGSRTFGTSTGY